MKSRSASKNSDSSALVCVVFAVAALEAFLGDLAKLVTNWNNDGAPYYGEKIYGMAELIGDMEDSKFQLRQKVYWVIRYLTNQRPNRGSKVFQDLELLICLRNAIIHLKDEEKSLWYDDGSMAIEGTPTVILQLESRGLVSRPYQPSWIVSISSIKIAEWSPVLSNSFCSLWRISHFSKLCWKL